MKVKVLQRFTDKHTGKMHEAGEQFEVTEERLAEIQTVSKRLVAVVKTARKSGTKREEKE